MSQRSAGVERVREAKARLLRYGIAKEEDARGCTEPDIASLEQAVGVTLPEVYSEFLRLMGREAGLLLVGIYKYLPELQRSARKSLEYCGADYRLPDKSFVISMGQAFDFLFFHTDAGDDPPVFLFEEGEAAPRQVSDSFSQWLLKNVEDHRIVLGPDPYSSHTRPIGDIDCGPIIAPAKSGPYNEMVHLLAESGQAEELRKLLSSNPQWVHGRDKNGQTPLHKASNADVAVVLVDCGAEVDAPGWMGETPLFEAVRGKQDVAALLIARGADVNARRPGRADTPLHFATTGAAAQLLLDNGAELEARDPSGATPLHWAARFGHVEVIGVLIAAGADVNCRRASEETPLHETTRWGTAAAADALLAAGAQVNAKDREERIPLHMAAWRGRNDVVKLLIEAGADINARSYWGFTPSEMARDNQLEETEKLILSYERSDV
jgi:ankyrin repeat protein